MKRSSLPPGSTTVLVCGLSLIGMLITVGFLLASCGAAHAAPTEWDKSSVALTGRCLADGRAEFTVTNNGAAMTGPTDWREYELGALAQSGTLQLAASASQIFSFGPVDGVVTFEVDQRPGHPGSSSPHLSLPCTPTAVSVRSFTAARAAGLMLPNLGNLGGCGRGNWWTVDCVVTDAGAGFVSGTCQYGLWFSRISTMRTFRLDQLVRVSGCRGLDGELYAPIRISRR